MCSEKCSVQSYRVPVIYDGFKLSLPKNSRVLGFIPAKDCRKMLVLQDFNQSEFEEREFFISFSNNSIPFPTRRLSLVGILDLIGNGCFSTGDYCLFEVCKE